MTYCVPKAWKPLMMPIITMKKLTKESIGQVTCLNDCHRFALGMRYALRPGGTALVVVGNSILQGITIPTDRYLGLIAESGGLELVGIEIPRSTRVGNSIIRSEVRVAKAEDEHRLYEAVVELRKR